MSKTFYKYKAMSLLEVVIVLGVVAITMVAATQLTVGALVRVKLDEIADFANGLAIQALETTQNPELGKIAAFGPPASGEFVGSYSVSSTNGENILVYQSSAVKGIEDCTTASAYRYAVTLPEVGNTTPLLCIQVIVTELNQGQVVVGITEGEQTLSGGTRQKYHIRTVSALVMNPSPIQISEFVGFRGVPFEVVNQ